MSRKVTIKYHPDRDPFEFEVGKLVTLQHPFKVDKLSPKMFTSWINDMADKGLIYHGQFDSRFVFRVDGIVIDQIKEKLELSSVTQTEYIGGDSGSMYKHYTTLSLNLDGTCLSEVSLP